MKRYNVVRPDLIQDSPDGEWCKATDVAKLEQQLADEEENCQGAWDCLNMVKDCLECEGTDMNGVAPMFYPEAIRNTIIRKLREQHRRALGVVRKIKESL